MKTPIYSTINLTLRDAYRTSDVNRWGIVRTARGQTVAEHSYHVAVIAQRIADLLDLPEEVRGRLLWAALTHDMPEVITGDLATPLKDLLGPDAVQNLEGLEGQFKFCGRNLGAFGMDQAMKVIVKMADVIEAAAFISAHGSSDHADKVRIKIIERVRRFGDVAEKVLFEIIDGPEHTMDDIMGNVSRET